MAKSRLFQQDERLKTSRKKTTQNFASESLDLFSAREIPSVVTQKSDQPSLFSTIQRTPSGDVNPVLLFGVVHSPTDQVQMRPKLTSDLPVEEFKDWYWKKEELITFCKAHSIPSSGLKPELELRIAAFLARKPLPDPTRPKAGEKLPSELRLETLIEEGWKCNPKLGAFFREHCGPSFRFNHNVRHFIHTQVGRSLAEAVECYRQTKGKPQPPLAQNELNAFMKSFSNSNPGVSRTKMMLEWERLKKTPRSQRKSTEGNTSAKS